MQISPGLIKVLLQYMLRKSMQIITDSSKEKVVGTIYRSQLIST